MYEITEKLRTLTDVDGYKIRMRGSEYAIIDSKNQVVVFTGTRRECFKKMAEYKSDS